MIEKCKFCGSTHLGVAYQLGNGQVYPDLYAYQYTNRGSSIEHILCKECGAILMSRVLHPERFPSSNTAKIDELEAVINQHGILLCNENKDIPSLSSLGYTMPDIITLIEQKKVFYCKLYMKKSTYLSVDTYLHFKRILKSNSLQDSEKMILDFMKNKECVDKNDIKTSLSIEKKEFDKAFDSLLAQCLITAIGGKQINPNWFEYLYCTSEMWKKGVEGLHTKANSKDILWNRFKAFMSEKQFEKMIK